jgi:transcriptional regulator with XRE-family HTH domain
LLGAAYPGIHPKAEHTDRTRLCLGVGKSIRELRTAHGLKQEDMCRFGFEYKYYQRVEYGQKNLSLKTLNRLAKAFGAPLSELFRFD